MIVMFTDFGLHGPYTGQMKAVLHERAPGIPVSSTCSPMRRPAIPGLRRTARRLCRVVFRGNHIPVRRRPRSGRNAAAARGRGGWPMVCRPRHGIFELIRCRSDRARTWDIQWRPERLSASFHGRDLFAPVAAMLARGEPPPGRPRRDTADRHPDWPDDLAEIVCVDHFGNAMTGLRAAMLSPDARIAAAGRVLERDDLRRPTAGCGLLVCELERACRNRHQPGTGRPRARPGSRHAGRNCNLKSRCDFLHHSGAGRYHMHASPMWTQPRAVIRHRLNQTSSPRKAGIQ